MKLEIFIGKDKEQLTCHGLRNVPRFTKYALHLNRLFYTRCSLKLVRADGRLLILKRAFKVHRLENQYTQPLT